MMDVELGQKPKLAMTVPNGVVKISIKLNSLFFPIAYCSFKCHSRKLYILEACQKHMFKLCAP